MSVVFEITDEDTLECQKDVGILKTEIFKRGDTIIFKRIDKRKDDEFTIKHFFSAKFPLTKKDYYEYNIYKDKDQEENVDTILNSSNEQLDDTIDEDYNFHNNEDSDEEIDERDEELWQFTKQHAKEDQLRYNKSFRDVTRTEPIVLVVTDNSKPLKHTYIYLNYDPTSFANYNWTTIDLTATHKINSKRKLLHKFQELLHILKQMKQKDPTKIKMIHVQLQKIINIYNALITPYEKPLKLPSKYSLTKRSFSIKGLFGSKRSTHKRPFSIKRLFGFGTRRV